MALTKIDISMLEDIPAPGSSGQVIKSDGTNWTSGADAGLPAVGADGQVLTSDGTNWASEAVAAGGFTLGTEQATTSGTSITIGSIPSGVTQIIINFEGVSLNGGGHLGVTIGDSGGLETSGYHSSSMRAISSNALAMSDSTADFRLHFGDASFLLHGTMTLTLKDSSNFTWVSTHTCSVNKNSHVNWGGGTKSLSAEITQLSLLALYGGDFDAGSVNIMYQ